MSQSSAGSIESVLQEGRKFAPRAEFTARANISSEAEYEKMWNRAKDDPAGFWGELAENLTWFKKYDSVLSGNMPDTKWFNGGKTPRCSASIGISRRGEKTKPPSSGKENRAIRACSVIKTFIVKSVSSPTYSSHSE